MPNVNAVLPTQNYLCQLFSFFHVSLLSYFKYFNYLSANLLAFSVLSSLVFSKWMVLMRLGLGFFWERLHYFCLWGFWFACLHLLFASYFYFLPLIFTFTLLTLLFLWYFSQSWQCLVFPFAKTLPPTSRTLPCPMSVIYHCSFQLFFFSGCVNLSRRCFFAKLTLEYSTWGVG